MIYKAKKGQATEKEKTTLSELPVIFNFNYYPINNKRLQWIVKNLKDGIKKREMKINVGNK